MVERLLKKQGGLAGSTRKNNKLRCYKVVGMILGEHGCNVRRVLSCCQALVVVNRSGMLVCTSVRLRSRDEERTQEKGQTTSHPSLHIRVPPPALPCPWRAIPTMTCFVHCSLLGLLCRSLFQLLLLHSSVLYVAVCRRSIHHSTPNMMNVKTLWAIEILILSYKVNSFTFSQRSDSTSRICSLQQQPRTQGDSSDTIVSSSPALSKAASKFKVVTCMSTSCSKKRKDLGLDSLSTFGAFYARSKQGGEGDDDLFIPVEEGPCMGACKMAPCVAIEHEEFVGRVSLEGMTDSEFSDRV